MGFVRARTGLLDARRGDLDVGQHHADGVVVDHRPDQLAMALAARGGSKHAERLLSRLALVRVRARARARARVRVTVRVGLG